MSTYLGQIRIDPVTGCHLWTGLHNSAGYAIHQGQLVHRLVYLDRYGSIPSNLELDHRCRRRSCVRVEHLEPVTRSVNERRKSYRRRSRERRCPNGHDYFTHGRLTREGGKVCLACAPLEESA